MNLSSTEEPQKCNKIKYYVRDLSDFVTNREMINNLI